MNPIASNQDPKSTLAINTIVVPQGAEYQAVCRGLQKTGEDKVQILTIPIGLSNLPEVLTRYSKQLNKVQNILLMGLCGSLSQLYQVGDEIIIESCQDLDCNQVNLDLDLTAKIKDILAVDGVVGLTSDHIITQAQSKQQLSQQYSASVVEMEGYGYVTQLQQRGMSVAMLRVVSDDLSGNLPDLSGAIDPWGNLRPIPMAIALAAQPRDAIRFIRGSLIGLKELEKVTARLFACQS